MKVTNGQNHKGREQKLKAGSSGIGPSRRPENGVNQNKFSNQVVIGKSENTDLGLVAGDKKAWLYLGRVKKETPVDSVDQFIKNAFPEVEAKVEKLESKSESYSSFKICVDFAKKDELMNSTVWPMNIVLKRFLFRRQNIKPTS